MRHLSDTLDEAAQRQLLGDIRTVIAKAPLFTPLMPRTGTAMSVRMTNAGTLGWVTDKARGYRYEASHPELGVPWPEIPRSVLELWRAFANYPDDPEACLVNYYGHEAKMGLHQDRDEEDFAAPVLSISLGDTAIFRMGGMVRKAPTRSFELKSGDIVVLEGADRLAYHGVDRIVPGSSDLLAEGGRFNLTLRRVLRARAL